MANLTVDLREGFDRTPVVVRVDGREALRDALTTRLQIGLARQLSLDVPGPGADVEIELPRSGARAHARVEALPAFVGVDLAGSALRVVVRAEPFGYV
jgi:hypothetical protein